MNLQMKFSFEILSHNLKQSPLGFDKFLRTFVKEHKVQKTTTDEAKFDENICKMRF